MLAGRIVLAPESLLSGRLRGRWGRRRGWTPFAGTRCPRLRARWCQALRRPYQAAIRHRWKNRTTRTAASASIRRNSVRGENVPFQPFFHRWFSSRPGGLFDVAVGVATPVVTGRLSHVRRPAAPKRTTGYPASACITDPPSQYFDEVAAFSVRALPCLGQGQAMDCRRAAWRHGPARRGEEFRCPQLRAGTAGARCLSRLVPTLDIPSVEGAYRFVIRPGVRTASTFPCACSARGPGRGRHRAVPSCPFRSNDRVGIDDTDRR